MKKTFLILIMGVLMMNSAIAKSPEMEVSLSAGARTSVPRDTLNLTLSIREEGVNRKAIAQKVDVRNERVMAKIRAANLTKEARSSRHTYPYNDDKNQQWLDEVVINLSGQNFVQLFDLVKAVENDAVAESIYFSLSADAQDSAQEQLVAQAVNNFKRRAQGVLKAVGGQSYRIVKLDFTNAQPMYAARTYAAKADAGAMNNGEESLQLDVSGVIQIQ